MRAALAALLLLQAVGGRARSPRAAPSFVAAPHAHLSKDFFLPAQRRSSLPPRSARRARTYGLQHLRGVSGGDNLRRADHVTEATNCDAPLRRRAEVRPRRLIRRRRPAQGAAPGAVCVRTTSPASRGPAKLRGSPAAAAARPQHASSQSRTAESLFYSFHFTPPPPRLTQPSAQAS